MKDAAGVFYQETATDYPVLDDRLRKALEICVREHPAVMLDIGCGRGFFASELRRRLPAARILGMELSPALADMARSQGVDVVRGDIADGIPLSDNSVDLVFLGEVIEHVFDPDSCVTEARRVLRPGGALIVTTPNLAAWTNRMLLPMGIQPLYSETSTRKRYGRWLPMLGQGSTVIQGHLRLFTRGALTEMLADLGLAVESVRGYRFFELDKIPIARFLDAAFCLWPSLASGLIVVARKPAGSALG